MARTVRTVPGFRSTSWPVRAACLVGVLAATGVVLTVDAKVAGLPDEYARAQSSSASWLAERPAQWEAWRRGTAKDLFPYIPIYMAWGVAVVSLIAPPRRASGPAARWTVRLTQPPWIILLPLVGAGLADVAETVLFRTSLTRFIGRATEADVDRIATATRGMTVVKALFGLATVALLVIHTVVRRPGGTAAKPE